MVRVTWQCAWCGGEVKCRHTSTIHTFDGDTVRDLRSGMQLPLLEHLGAAAVILTAIDVNALSMQAQEAREHVLLRPTTEHAHLPRQLNVQQFAAARLPEVRRGCLLVGQDGAWGRSTWTACAPAALTAHLCQPSLPGLHMVRLLPSHRVLITRPPPHRSCKGYGRPWSLSASWPRASCCCGTCAGGRLR
jgi:hypothetical protein